MFVSLSYEINEKWQLVLLFCPVVLPVGSSLVKSIVWHHHAPFRHKTKHVTHTKTCFKNVFHCTTVKPIHTWSIEVPFNQPCACIMSFWKPLNVEISWNDFAVVSWLRPSFAPSSYFEALFLLSWAPFMYWLQLITKKETKIQFSIPISTFNGLMNWNDSCIIYFIKNLLVKNWLYLFSEFSYNILMLIKNVV